MVTVTKIRESHVDVHRQIEVGQCDVCKRSALRSLADARLPSFVLWLSLNLAALVWDCPQAMLAGANFLQGFVDFCLGCFIFEYLIKFGLVSKAVYRMHVNTRYVFGRKQCRFERRRNANTDWR